LRTSLLKKRASAGIKFHVDYNERELLRDDVQTIVVSLGGRNAGIHCEDLREGITVVL
jgi:hypothetical protein